MSYSRETHSPSFFREVYNPAEQYLGSIYLNASARKWAIKEYPGQWFDTEQDTRNWLIQKNQPTAKG